MKKSIIKAVFTILGLNCVVFATYIFRNIVYVFLATIYQGVNNELSKIVNIVDAIICGLLIA